MEHTKPTRTKRQKASSIAFELPINGRSYNVTATPSTVASGEQIYRVSYNNSPVHVFGWDEGLDRFVEADTQADLIPPVVEMAIAERLREVASQMQEAA